MKEHDPPPTPEDSGPAGAPGAAVGAQKLPDLHRSDSRRLARCVEDLHTAHPERLQSISLTGEAATGDYRARRSPLSLVVVVDSITPAVLRATQKFMRRRHWRRAGVPLLIDPRYIESSLDVFPLEFLDFVDRHVTLHGEDPFTGLRIDTLHLRMEVEERLRGKMLHLWEAYLRCGGRPRALRRLLLETPVEFEIGLRGLLRLHLDERPPTGLGIVAEVQDNLGVELPTLVRLEQVRAGGDKLARAELADVFDAYLDEVRTLVRLVDEL